jgi:hypothetical protein
LKTSTNILKEFFKDIDKNSKHDANNNHGNNRKIKPEVFSFNTNIARQFAKPVQLIVKEINKHAYDYNDNTGSNYPFACLRIHRAKFSYSSINLPG